MLSKNIPKFDIISSLEKSKYELRIDEGTEYKIQNISKDHLLLSILGDL